MQNLSTKEVNYIKDLLSWELLTTKKCFHYANQETNSEHKKVFAGLASMHQQNYLGLLVYVDQIISRQGGQVQ
ncbi:MAG: hypothetical protein BWY74_01171 [Firmicutes bacterium ADurb.Bin419]|nr:MAG: hypothetical protein BWY74_01171 [Firmicutes bacterium ADurb.Bin419]